MRRNNFVTDSISKNEKNKNLIMKTLITYASIFLTISILLTSCGSVSITKRQHTKGYHISHHNMKHNNDVSNTDEESKNVAEKAESIDQTQESIERSEINSKKVAELENSKKTSIAKEIQPEKSNSVANVSEKKNNSDNAKETLTTDSKKAPFSVKKITSKVKDTVNNSKIKNLKAESDSDLSLLWIIILVVLILWLLGVLGGVGEIIHLLLVVALILLVLWLLGVI